MPTDKINEVRLFWELSGSKGEPLILVHGSWGDHHNWDRVTGELSKTFRVVTYDRRGHSQSERLKEQGTMEQDVSDLIALLEFLNLSPAHIVGNSGGAAIALKTAARRPKVFRSLVIHEPPLFDLIKNIPEAGQILQNVNSRIEAVVNLLVKGENAGAARLFVETIAFGTGEWQKLPAEAQKTFIYNAPTFYDEILDPENLNMDLGELSHFNKPTLLTAGSQSPPFFLIVLDQLERAIPNAHRMTFEGAGHVPHMSNPQQFVEVVKDFCLNKTNKNQ